MTSQWEESLQGYRERKYRVLAQDDLTRVAIEIATTGVFTPPSVHLFLQRLIAPWNSFWDAFLGSVESTNTSINDDDVRDIWRPLIGHITHFSIIHGEEDFSLSPNQWSYFIEVTGLFGGQQSQQYFLLHPPATREHIQQAEAVIGCSLPPTFVRFLQWTNGFGIGDREFCYINGAGEERAPWPAITSWTRFSTYYHEIAHYWWSWQDVYSYERQMDQERGAIADRSAEQICIPFAQTADYWCFDHSKPDRYGEYPVLFWDHETRTATFEYPSFGSWFLEGIIRGRELDENS